MLMIVPFVVAVCDDGDGGMNLEVKGSLPQTLHKGIVYTEDFCLDGFNLIEGSCFGGLLVTNNVACPIACSDGICVDDSSEHDADTNRDSVISTTELITYAQKWINGQISRPDLAVSLALWMVS